MWVMMSHSNEIDAIILSGGKGTRLRSVTMDKIPKGLVRIKEKPILEWELIWLRKHGIRRAIFAIGHLADKIKDYFGDVVETPWGTIEVDYSVEKEKLGSGGAVRLASSLVTANTTLLLNGDVLTTIDLSKMISFHFERSAPATMALVKLPSPFGVIEVEGDLITKFVEKPLLPVWIHSGVDLIKSEILSSFPTKGQMEDTIFVELAKKKRFYGFQASDEVYWTSIDTQKEYEKANKEFPQDAFLAT